MIMQKLALISLCLMAGCMVGPRYEEPQIPFAPEFAESEEESGAEIDLRSWWTQFEDPILNQMIEEAIEKNYDLRISAEKIEEVRAKYNLASANLWPEIDLNGSITRNKITQNICGGGALVCPPVQNLFQIGFDASWELDFFGRLRSLKEAAYDELQASQENMRDVYVTLLAELTRSYADYRSFQKKISLTQRQIQVEKDLLYLSDVRFQAGLKSEIEPLQTKALLDSLEATLPPLEAAKNQSLYAMAVLVGRQPEDIPESWRGEGDIPEAEGKIPVGLPSDLLRRRPDIRQAERLLAAATAQVGATIALLFPSFSLTGSFGYESNQAGTFLFPQKSKVWSVGPSVFWPVIDFGRIRAQIDFTKAVQRETLLNYEKIVLDALQEVEDALVAYFQEEKRREYLKMQVEDLGKSFALTADLYQAGLVSFTNFLDAEQQVLFAEQTWLSSEQTLSQNLMAVYKSLGGDWPCSTTP
jgi:NodT family efflux transporter outer membrane factor (OMF) lipoprotein